MVFFEKGGLRVHLLSGSGRHVLFPIRLKSEVIPRYCKSRLQTNTRASAPQHTSRQLLTTTSCQLETNRNNTLCKLSLSVGASTPEPRALRPLRRYSTHIAPAPPHGLLQMFDRRSTPRGAAPQTPTYIQYKRPARRSLEAR